MRDIIALIAGVHNTRLTDIQQYTLTAVQRCFDLGEGTRGRTTEYNDHHGEEEAGRPKHDKVAGAGERRKRRKTQEEGVKKALVESDPFHPRFTYIQHTG